ncbi:MAG TPA: triose-phosphate isomerase [Clostridia bacterium]|nr:triose-phosphate isomerase [Clostridia bacterium]
MSNFRVFINFKTYPQATGKKAVGLAEVLEEVQQSAPAKKAEIIPLVQTADLYPVAKKVKIPVWVQHLDPYPQGKFTGWVTLETVSQAGAKGALLNHSEHPLPPGTVKQSLSRIKKSSAGFQVMVAAKTLGQLERLVKLKPDFLAYEMAELIGGETSITEANPKAIKKALKLAQEIPLIVGAGINQAQDLATAQKLGAKGVLIASAVTLASSPKKKLTELLSLLK